MNEARWEFDLSGNHWKMEKIRPGAGIMEEFHLLPSEYQGTYYSWNQARVPGDVYTDLHRAGELDDPYFGRNLHKCKWVQEYECWYMCKFNVPPEMEGKTFQIIFEGVDYSCEAWLNGQYIGAHEGALSTFAFDVTNKVRFEQWHEGCNILMIKLDPPPRNYRRVGGRKVCFSGDYMTGLVPFGIWRPVKVRATDAVRIDNLRIESDINESGATVNVDVELFNKHYEPAENVTVRATVKGENFTSDTYTQSLTCRLGPREETIELNIDIPDAKLWWPWDMGDQNLYEVEVTIEQGGVAHDTKREVFGVREITMARNPGFTDDEVENPWTFMINGKRHYLRSACWGGPPSWLYGRNPDQKYVDRLDLVKECNINNLRIFGWHPPECPLFYELCDRLGITVWTNFTFATQAFKADKEFLDPAIRECVNITKQIRNHPSNIIFMGGEEVFFSHAHVDSDNKLIMAEVGKAVEKVTATPYGQASPMSETYGRKLGFKSKESSHANEHYYGAGHVLMEEYYGKLDFCVVPELTAASAPNVESLKKFIPENELWPMGPSWGYHGGDMDILKLLNVEVFGEERLGSLEEFVEATQIAQGMIFQYALEALRRKKPRVSGAALCHFMTNWPDIKWGLIDYYGEKKLSFDYVKRCYQPLIASLHYEKRRWNPGESLDASTWIINDYHNGYDNVTLTWKVIDAKGQAVAEDSQNVNVAPDSSVEVCPVTWTVAGSSNDMFKVEMTLTAADGSILSTNYHTLLVGDQQKAKDECKSLQEKRSAKTTQFGKSYFRYYPELWEFD